MSEYERYNVPWIDNVPERRKPLEPNPVIGHCPECGIALHEVMHYVCPRDNCPTGLGGVKVTW